MDPVIFAARRNRAIFEPTETALRNHVGSLELLPMSTTSEGSLFFLLFIPILWVLWLWVLTVSTCFTRCLLTILCQLTDDSLETRYHMPRLSSLLPLPCHVLFC